MNQRKCESFVVLSSFSIAALFAGCSQNSSTSLNTEAHDALTGTGRIATIRANYSAGQITELCDRAVATFRASGDRIAQVANNARTVENTLMALENARADLEDSANPLLFMGYVSRDEKVRAEGSQCEAKYERAKVDVLSRRDLFLALQSLRPTQANERRLRSETLKFFEENGVGGTDESAARAKDLVARIKVNQASFSENLNNDVSTVHYAVGELAGAPQRFLDRLPRDAEGKLVVTTKNTDYQEVMQNVSVSASRQRMMLAYNNRGGAENIRLLEETIRLRQEAASVMNYPTWADYRTHFKMAGSARAVWDFFGRLRPSLMQQGRRDLAALLQLKQEREPGATELKAWDIDYYAYQLKKRDFNLDDELIRQYFPADTVVRGMFSVYSRLLGVTFREVPSFESWSPDVKLYEISDTQSGALMAYFYADFYPRPGKYGHAAAFDLIGGRRVGDHYSVPSAAIVANFRAPENGKPSLLSHSEVETIFHEFGHIMHNTLTRAPYLTLSGARVARDFVEAPSQMLENWVWAPEVLAELSGHYEHPEQKLPADLLARMIQAKEFNQGYHYLRQLMLATLDMTFHTQTGAVDTTRVYNQLFHDFFGVDAVDGGHFSAGFGHLMGDYDAGYYGYLWSEVYAEDMFSRFERQGLLNPAVGAQYRRSILERGKMADGLKLLREFLGREPNARAFFRKLHITTSQNP